MSSSKAMNIMATPPRFQRPSMFDGALPLPMSNPFSSPSAPVRRIAEDDEDLDDSLVSITRKLSHVVGLERTNHPLENIPDAEIATLLPAHETTLRQFLYSEVRDDHLRAVVLLRKFCCISEPEGEWNNVRAVVNLQAMPRLIELLGGKDAHVIYETSWLMTNICAGPSSYTVAVMKAGAVPVLVDLLKSPAWRVRWQAIWNLGNILGDSSSVKATAFSHAPDMIDRMVRATDLTHVIDPDAEEYELANTSVLRVCVWAIGNSARWDNKESDVERLSVALPLLLRLLHSTDDPQLLTEVLRTLKYVLHEPRYDCVAEHIDEKLTGRLSELLKYLPHGEDSLTILVLRVLTNLSSGSDDQTQLVLEEQNVLDLLPEMMSHRNASIRLHSSMLLSNFCAGTSDQVQHVFDAGLLTPMVAGAQELEDDWKVARELIWALSNTTDSVRQKGNAQAVGQMWTLVSNNVIPILLKALVASRSGNGRSDASLFVRVSDALVNLFIFSETPDANMAEAQKHEAFVQHFLSCGGLDVLLDVTNPVNRPRQDSGTDITSPTSSKKESGTSKEFDRGTLNLTHILGKHLADHVRKRAPDASEFDAMIAQIANVSISKQIEESVVPNRKILTH
ncbi:armadillo-type protein [Hyaloraphidium curvatum]|nr:armadillo-type protein [Hyaloraphidium curvatum]